MVGAVRAAAILVALQGVGRLVLVLAVGGAAVAVAQRVADRPHRYRARAADEAACTAEREAVDVLDAERIDLRVAARSHDRAVADLGVDVVLQHAYVHRACGADEAPRDRTGEGGDVGLVGRADVHALGERRAGVAAGLIDARVADPGERVGADHAHVDRPGYADEAAAGGHREVHDLLARPGLHDHAVARRGVEARRVVAAGECAVVDAGRAAAPALGVDGRAVGDEGLRVLADDEHAHGSAYADEAGAEAAADDEHLGVVGGRDRDVAARRDGAADRREGVVVEAEHAHASAHADRACGDAEADHQQVLARVRVDAHVALRVHDPRDGRVRIVVQHRHVDARRHPDGAEAGARRQRDVVEVARRRDDHRLAACRARQARVHMRVLVDVRLGVRVDYVHRCRDRNAGRAAADRGGIGVDLVGIRGRHRHALHRRGIGGEGAVAARRIRRGRVVRCRNGSDVRLLDLALAVQRVDVRARSVLRVDDLDRRRKRVAGADACARQVGAAAADRLAGAAGARQVDGVRIRKRVGLRVVELEDAATGAAHVILAAVLKAADHAGRVAVVVIALQIRHRVAVGKAGARAEVDGFVADIDLRRGVDKNLRRQSTVERLRLGVVEGDVVGAVVVDVVVVPVLQAADRLIQIAGTLVVGDVVASAQAAARDVDRVVRGVDVACWVEADRRLRRVGDEAGVEAARLHRCARGLAIAGDRGAVADERLGVLRVDRHRGRGADAGAAAHRDGGDDLVELGLVVGRDRDRTERVHVACARERRRIRIVANEGARGDVEHVHAGVHAHAGAAADRDTRGDGGDFLVRVGADGDVAVDMRGHARVDVRVGVLDEREHVHARRNASGAADADRAGDRDDRGRVGRGDREVRVARRMGERLRVSGRACADGGRGVLVQHENGRRDGDAGRAAYAAGRAEGDDVFFGRGAHRDALAARRVHRALRAHARGDGVVVHERSVGDANASAAAAADRAGDHQRLHVTLRGERDVAVRGGELHRAAAALLFRVGARLGDEHHHADRRRDARAARAQAEGGGDRGDVVVRLRMDRDVAVVRRNLRAFVHVRRGVAHDHADVEADAHTGAAGGSANAACRAEHGDRILRRDRDALIGRDVRVVLDEGVRVDEIDVDAGGAADRGAA